MGTVATCKLETRDSGNSFLKIPNALLIFYTYLLFSQTKPFNKALIWRELLPGCSGTATAKP